MSSYKKPSNYTSIPVTCSTSREPLKTSKIDRIQQSPWRPATIYKNSAVGTSLALLARRWHFFFADVAASY